MIPLLLGLTAWAAEPLWGGAAVLSAGALDRVGQSRGGAHLWGSLPLGNAFDVELSALVEGGDEIGLELRPGLRAWLVHRQDPVSLSADLSVGVDFLGGPLPVAQPGLALDLALGPRLALRIGTGVLLGVDGGGPAARAFRLEIGLRRRPALPVSPPIADEVPLPPEPLVAEPVDAPSLRPPPDGPMAWIPHPICAWIPLDTAGPILEELGIPIETVVISEGHLPAYAPFAPGTPYAGALGAEAPLQGGLLVLGHPGDLVQIDGHPVLVGSDGVAVVNVQPGVVRVEAVGGGVRSAEQLTIVDGKAAWLRLADPPDRLLRFTVDSASLDAAATQILAVLAEDAGAWRFRLQGGASPEGNAQANAELAMRRAEAARAWLVDHGIPADRLEVGAPFAPDPEMPLEAQRICRITPIAEVAR